MNKKIPLILLLVLSFLFRFYQLTSYPIHPSMDEMAIRFSAINLLQNGRDEWGDLLPLAFKSQGDYKPPVNVYLTALSIKFFGDTYFASRFASAFLGSLTPLVVFLLLCGFKFTYYTSFLTSLWFAALPWHWHFSRGAYEAITGLFFFLLSILFFQKNKPVLTVLFVCLSIWSYHSFRLFVPFFYFFILLPKLKVINLNPKAILLLSFFLLPIFYLSITSQAISQRARATFITSDPNLKKQLTGDFVYDFSKILPFWLERYLEYWDPLFIFSYGLDLVPKDKPSLGILFLIDLPIIFYGLYKLKDQKKDLKYLVILLALLGPLPSSLTENRHHPLRALTWLPFFILLFATGLQNIKAKKVLLIYILFLPLQILYTLNIYTLQSPYYFSEYWQYGFKQSANYVCQNYKKYDQIYFGNTFGSLGPLNSGLPHLYLSKECNWTADNLEKEKTVNKLVITRQVWNEVHKNSQKILVVASPWDFINTTFPKKNIIETIYFKNGKVAFYILDNQVAKDSN